MWGQPMFDLADPAGVMLELRRCREAFPNNYIKINAYDARLGRQTTALSFITDRPAEEPGFVLDRQEDAGRAVRYSLRPYTTQQPSGHRYTG
jgi:ribulose-bisphosphate carboxylase small chain